MVAFRGRSSDAIRFEQTAAILLDVPAYREWIPYISASYIVKRFSADHFIVYQRFDFTWPYDDRDILAEVRINRNYPEGIFTAEIRAIDDTALKAVPDNCLRMTRMSGTVTIRFIDHGTTEGTFTELFDPAGYIPSWLANAISERIPSTVLKNLRSRARTVGAHPDAAGIRAELERRMPRYRSTP
ncbi:MAG: hypothetical protein BWY76_03248 [bacterium ADurb.Bin429]|nr:MAG: hypothetical protein BWY76_03248 [bacterium ADurb.Bin429]